MRVEPPLVHPDGQPIDVLVLVREGGYGGDVWGSSTPHRQRAGAARRGNCWSVAYAEAADWRCAAAGLRSASATRPDSGKLLFGPCKQSFRSPRSRGSRRLVTVLPPRTAMGPATPGTGFATSPPAPVLCLVISVQALRSQPRVQNSPLQRSLQGTMGPDLRPAPDGSGLGMSELIAIDTSSDALTPTPMVGRIADRVVRHHLAQSELQKQASP